MRDIVRAKGFVFSRRHTSLWKDYNVIPLLCLQLILDGRVVPYCDNVSPLRAASPECCAGTTTVPCISGIVLSRESVDDRLDFVSLE